MKNGFRNRVLPLLILGVISFLALFLLRTIQFSPDSLNYAKAADSGFRMFHPHHLLYIPGVHLFRLLFPQASVLMVAQAFNAVLATACVLLVFGLVRRFSGKAWLAFLAGLIFLGLNGFWIYSTQIEVYVPSLAFLGLLSAVFFRMEEQGEVRRRDLAVAGIALGMAVLFHQTNVLICLALLAAWPFLKSPKPTGRLWLTFVLTGLAVFAIYVAAAVVQEGARNFDGLMQFFFHYTYAPSPDWGTEKNLSFRNLILMMGNQYLNVFRIDPGQRMQFGGQMLGLVILLIGWNSVSVFRKGRMPAFRVFLMVWLVVFYGFFLWWLPDEREFSIVTLFPLILLTLLMLDDWTRMLESRIRTKKWAWVPSTVLLTALLVFIFDANAESFVKLHRNRSWGRTVAEDLHAINKEKCRVFVGYDALENFRFLYNFEIHRLDQAVWWYAYDGIKSREDVAAGPDECILVQAWFLDPKVKYNGKDGFTNPEDYLKLLGLFFDIDSLAGSAGIRARNAEMLRSGVTTAWKIGTEKSEYPSLRDFLEALDKEASRFLGNESFLYRKWYEDTREGQ
jgi:hypothetical protein